MVSREETPKNKNTVFFILFILFIFVIVAFLFFAKAPPEADGDYEAGVYAGISFEDFWNLAITECHSWAKDKCYVDQVSVLYVKSFKRQKGLSAAWGARLVLCGKLRHKENPDTGEVEYLCQGISKVVVMTESGIGAAPGFDDGEESHVSYYAPAVKPERINIFPGSAEIKANAFKQYAPNGYEDYMYELDVMGKTGKPYWKITKTCSYEGIAKNKCTSGDIWTVYVDAEDGSVLK